MAASGAAAGSAPAGVSWRSPAGRAGRALGPGAHYLAIFRFAGVTAFAGYSLALWQSTIWYKRSATTTLKSTLDGLVYALCTAGVFGWLWPK